MLDYGGGSASHAELIEGELRAPLFHFYKYCFREHKDHL